MSALNIKVAICTILLASLVLAQGKDAQNKEDAPSLNFYTCTKASGCSHKPKKVVMDQNWRWIHNKGGYTNCYDGSSWNTTYCNENPLKCAQQCVLDGADYRGVYGVYTDNSNEDLTLKFKVNNNVGSRLY